MSKKKDRESLAHQEDKIYDDGTIVVFTQGYGFDNSDELSPERVAQIIRDNGLKGSLNKEGKRELRGLI